MNLHPPHRIQRGAVLLLLMLVFLISGIWLGIRALSNAQQPANPDLSGLTAAKDALLGATATGTADVVIVPGVASPGRLPAPDFLDGAPPTTYDGKTNLACARSTWAPGASLQILGGPGGISPNLRCLGRLPWDSLGLGSYASVPENDPLGVIPWYAVSVNVTDACINKLNPLILNTSFPTSAPAFTTGNCDQVLSPSQPFPWLTVLDAKGNLLTNRAAAVLLLPGPPLSTQARPAAPLAGPSGYLDTVTVLNTCTQPCVPGTYNNARFNWPNNQNPTYIQCAPKDTVSTEDPNYAQPYNCNDRLVFITIDELMDVAERRALQYAAERLRQYFSINGFYPYAAPLGNVNIGECQDLMLSGLLPSKITTTLPQPNPNPNPCTHARFDSDPNGWPASPPAPPQPRFKPWFNTNSWGEFIYYAVAPGCTQFSPPESSRQDCKGSSARLASGAINNARAILIGTGAPILAHPYADLIGTAPVPQVRPSSKITDYLDSPENQNGDNRYDATDKKVARNFVDAKVGRSYGYNDKVLVVAP